MLRRQRVSSKSAALSELDEDSAERLAEFTAITEGLQHVSTRRLLWLAVVFSGPLKLKQERSPKPSGDVVMLGPHTVVMTPQQFVGVEKVNHYLVKFSAGEALKPARVYDVGDGEGWWHLDGLHRLLAARILGQSLEAKIYR